jgi:hypothetical protein
MTKNGFISARLNESVPQSGPATPQWAVMLPWGAEYWWTDKMMLKKGCALYTASYMKHLLLISLSCSCISFYSCVTILSVTHSMWPQMVG